MNFLFWLYLFGLFIAFAQDVKRREVDNWLNLFLLISGSAFFVFENQNVSDVFLLTCFILFFFLLSHLMYYGRFFAGGDAKLLFAMAPFFVSSNLSLSLFNVGLFLFVLLLSGSVYGLAYSFVLGILHFNELNKLFISEWKKMKGNLFLVVCALFLLLGFFNSIFVFFSFFILFFILLFVYAKSVEKVSMYKSVEPKLLREGDWLVRDLKVGNRTFKARFDGLTKEEIKFIQRSKKKILIKDGLPFVPSFLIAFFVYSYFYDVILKMVFGLIFG